MSSVSVSQGLAPLATDIGPFGTWGGVSPAVFPPGDSAERAYAEAALAVGLFRLLHHRPASKSRPAFQSQLQGREVERPASGATPVVGS